MASSTPKEEIRSICQPPWRGGDFCLYRAITVPKSTAATSTLMSSRFRRSTVTSPHALWEATMTMARCITSGGLTSSMRGARVNVLDLFCGAVCGWSRGLALPATAPSQHARLIHGDAKSSPHSTHNAGCTPMSANSPQNCSNPRHAYSLFPREVRQRSPDCRRRRPAPAALGKPGLHLENGDKLAGGDGEIDSVENDSPSIPGPQLFD